MHYNSSFLYILIMTYHLSSLGIVRISGKDALPFLHSQLSNHILELKTGEACYAAYTSVQGRVIANGIVICQLDNELLFIVKRNLIAHLLKILNFYKVRRQIALEDQSANYLITVKMDKSAITTPPFPFKFATHKEGDSLVIPCPDGSTIQLLPPSNLSSINIDNDWQLFEIEQGISWIESASSGKYVPQMLNLEHLGALHFKKGCYPGQEVIARAQYRGVVRRRPALLIANQQLDIASAVYANKEVIGSIVACAKQTDQHYAMLAVLKISAKNESLYADIEGMKQSLHCEKLFIYQGHLA